MKHSNRPFLRKVLIPAMAFLIITQAAQSQQAFTNHSTGDLTLGFRKASPYTEAFDVVVNIGRATNFVNQAAGTTSNLTGFNTAQLVTGSFSTYDNLSWSVFADAHNSGVPGYPSGTLWLTTPRDTFGVQSDPPDRALLSEQNVVVGKIESILNGAVDISGRLGASNTYNTTTLVREPLNTNSITQGENLANYIAGSDSTQGTFGDAWYDENSSPINVENVTGTNFISPLQSDLYEIRPVGSLDPHTSMTDGSAYYIGYFQLNTDGSMTFTRASSSTTPPAPVLTLTRFGNTSTISFTTTNGAVYTLYGTNISGLAKSVASWPVLGSTITGNGGTTNFTDTTTDAGRVYRVGAH
jgi:hypothetical protein